MREIGVIKKVSHSKLFSCLEFSVDHGWILEQQWVNRGRTLRIRTYSGHVFQITRRQGGGTFLFLHLDLDTNNTPNINYDVIFFLKNMLWKHTVTGARRYSAAKICDGKILSLSFSLAQFNDIG